ncbi:unnamed protein product [Rotaria sp. Silwood2]|nr:unnamed protein product [Rotaria sp. Silwood2]
MVHSLTIAQDTRSFNGTNLLLNIAEEHQEPLSFCTPYLRSLADGTVNTNIFTLFNYNGGQVYVYSSFANENENNGNPQRWIFYYVSIMAPMQTSKTNVSVWSMKNEVRVKLMLGDRELEHIACKAISKKFDIKIAEYSKYWDIAPLMIDSLTAYMVTGSNSPVAGVQPYHSVHPNSLVMIFRLPCSTEDNVRQVAQMINSGEYEIEIAFYFDGFKHTPTSLLSITAEQLNSVSSKTTVDGGMENARRTTIDASLLNETWSSADFQPDRITSEHSQVFTKNVSDTEQHTASDKYLSIDKEYLKEILKSNSKEGGAIVSFLGISVDGNGGSSSSSKSKDGVVKLLNEQQVDFSWKGEKLVPKSFQVYKMTDLTDSLQVALVAKQITIDKDQSAIIRHVSTMNSPTATENSQFVNVFLTREIKLYSGRTHPLSPWLFYNGSAASRIFYQRLFAIIGVTCGSGNGSTTFNIPDFQGRVPVDSLGLRTMKAYDLGLTGGNETHAITANQLPSHSHSPGSVSMSSSGSHSHSINDPGHNHGGYTGESGFLNGNDK